MVSRTSFNIRDIEGRGPDFGTDQDSASSHHHPGRDHISRPRRGAGGAGADRRSRQQVRPTFRSQGCGSLLTLRWREAGSNPRFPAKKPLIETVLFDRLFPSERDRGFEWILRAHADAGASRRAGSQTANQPARMGHWLHAMTRRAGESGLNGGTHPFVHIPRKTTERDNARSELTGGPRVRIPPSP
jgi:hypothetical protein